MPDDIVKQLRDSACLNDCRCHYCNRNKAAADALDLAKVAIDALLETISSLSKQRDEARREVCVLSVTYANFYSVGEEKEAAKDRGWDCFKEETP